MRLGHMICATALLAALGGTFIAAQEADDTPQPTPGTAEDEAPARQVPSGRPVGEVAWETDGTSQAETVSALLDEHRLPGGRRYDVDGLVDAVSEFSKQWGAGQSNLLMRGLFDDLPTYGAYDPAFDFAFGVSWLDDAPTGIDERIVLGYPRRNGDRLASPATFRRFLDRYVERAAEHGSAKRKVSKLGKSYTQGFPVAAAAVTSYLAILRADGGGTNRWNREIREVVQWVFGITEPGVAFDADDAGAAQKTELAAEIEAIRDVIGDTRTDEILDWIEAQ